MDKLDKRKPRGSGTDALKVMLACGDSCVAQCKVTLKGCVDCRCRCKAAMPGKSPGIAPDERSPKDG